MTALDQSPEMLAVARRAAQQEGLSIDFRLAPLDEGLPLEANQFDLVVCALMLCHVPDLSHALQEFARVLRSGGSLVITDFHPDSVSYGWRTGFRQAGVRYRLPNMPHTRDDYLEAMKKSGLGILQAIDLPLGALPEREFPPPLTREFIAVHGERMLCLIVVGRKME
ncbi:MAG TPA: class I SAM-dependent methyltransferase [Ktedonosporobacter sp.]|nr:class I SAM-dependent methyltransferase [Ktedonosporobacter sp.]